MIPRESFDCISFVAFCAFLRGESGTVVALSLIGKLSQ